MISYFIIVQIPPVVLEVLEKTQVTDEFVTFRISTGI